jgi:V8-like Glu-specific endopeptidase
MRRTRTVVSILALVAFATVGSIPATAADRTGVIASNGGRAISATVRANALRYWTRTRMAQARAVPEPAAPTRRPDNGLADPTRGTPTLVAGSLAADPTIPAADPTPTEYAYPFPYDRYQVESALVKLAPYKAIGRIFFRSEGQSYSCSGASVVGGSRQIVMTAGHCLNWAGAWSTKVVFVPAYRAGVRPFGSFAAKVLWVPTAWYESMDPSYDMGAFDVARNAAGKMLRTVAGKLGFAYNLTRDVHWNVFGFPAEAPFDGRTLQVCQASHATDDLSTGTGGGPLTMAIGCDMNGGSSGGPWIFRFKRGSYLNGIVSYGYDTQPEGMYGPYFGDAANNLRCAAGTGNPTATSC